MPDDRKTTDAEDRRKALHASAILCATMVARLACDETDTDEEALRFVGVVRTELDRLIRGYANGATGVGLALEAIMECEQGGKV